MTFGVLRTGDRWPVWTRLKSGPAQTLIAAGILGLMWGPILASVLYVADTPAPEGDVSGEPGSTKVAAAALSDEAVHTVRGPDQHPISAVSVSVAADDEALNRLATMTRFHRLSSAGRVTGLDDAATD